MAMTSIKSSSSISKIVHIEELLSWNTSEVPEYSTSREEDKPIIFSCDPIINEKIVIWHGSIDDVSAHVMVDTINRYAVDVKSLDNIPVHSKEDLKNCRTGEVRLTTSLRGSTRYSIFTVAPNYNRNYKSAAHTALYNCYRNALLLAMEKKFKTILLPTIQSHSRTFPYNEGIHIALRTVRRFLEKSGNLIERILFHVPEQYKSVYYSLMPLYFPRNKSEELFSASHLPEDIGNENGEPVLIDRAIRIAPYPIRRIRGGLDDSSGDESDPSSPRVDIGVEAHEGLEDLTSPGAHPFSRMEQNPDQRRKSRTIPVIKESKNRLVNQRRYDRLLRRARKMDVSVFSSFRCLYQSGNDMDGRPIIIVIGKYFPALTINYREAMLYFIHLMDRIVNQAYTVIYMHTDSSNENQPELSFLKEVYNIVDDRYKTNLHAFYIVHPTFWASVLTWFFTTFTSPEIKSKVHRISCLASLFKYVNPRQLDLPEFCYDYDKKLFGKERLARPRSLPSQIDYNMML